MNQLINKSSKLSSKTKRRIRRSLQRQFPNNKCPYCEINIAFTIDHIIPKCLGGKNTLDNLIAEEEFSAEVMANIAKEYKKIKSNIKSLEEEIKSKQELLDLNLSLANNLNQWVETKDIDLVNEVLTTIWE